MASNICQALEIGLTLYEQAFNQAPYNCYCADIDTLCNQCLTTQQGMQITRKTATNAFTVFLHNTGQDSKATEKRISAASFELLTVAFNSYPDQAGGLLRAGT